MIPICYNILKGYQAYINSRYITLIGAHKDDHACRFLCDSTIDTVLFGEQWGHELVSECRLIIARLRHG